MQAALMIAAVLRSLGIQAAPIDPVAFVPAAVNAYRTLYARAKDGANVASRHPREGEAWDAIIKAKPAKGSPTWTLDDVRAAIHHDVTNAVRILSTLEELLDFVRNEADYAIWSWIREHTSPSAKQDAPAEYTLAQRFDALKQALETSLTQSAMIPHGEETAWDALVAESLEHAEKDDAGVPVEFGPKCPLRQDAKGNWKLNLPNLRGVDLTPKPSAGTFDSVTLEWEVNGEAVAPGTHAREMLHEFAPEVSWPEFLQAFGKVTLPKPGDHVKFTCGGYKFTATRPRD